MKGKGGRTEASQEPIAGFQATDPAGKGVGDENLPDTGYILKVKPKKIRLQSSWKNEGLEIANIAGKFPVKGKKDTGRHSQGQ